MNRIIRGQLIASTHLDRHGERLPREIIIELFRQMEKDGIPAAVSHDFSQAPIARSLNPRLEELPDGELAILIDVEILDEDKFSTMRGYSISFLRGGLRFGNGEPVVSFLLNPRQFDFREVAGQIKSASPEGYTIDVRERVEKGDGLTAAIIAVVVSASIQVAGGFFSAAGERLFEALLKLRRKDQPDGVKQIQLHFELEVSSEKGPIVVVLVAEPGVESIDFSGVSVERLAYAIARLPGMANAVRVVGRLKKGAVVELDRVVLGDSTSVEIGEGVAEASRVPQLTSRSAGRKQGKRGSAG